MDKSLTIHIKEAEGKKIIGFELKDISEDEAIVIFARCLFRLLGNYDDFLTVRK